MNQNKLHQLIPFTYLHSLRYDVHLHSIFSYSLDEMNNNLLSYKIVELWTRKNTRQEEEKKTRGTQLLSVSLSLSV